MEYRLRGFGSLELFVVSRGVFGGTSAVGRSQVDNKITAQENNDAWMVLFHLKQTVMLNDEQVIKIVPLETDEKDL